MMYMITDLHLLCTNCVSICDHRAPRAVKDEHDDPLPIATGPRGLHARPGACSCAGRPADAATAAAINGARVAAANRGASQSGCSLPRQAFLQEIPFSCQLPQQQGAQPSAATSGARPCLLPGIALNAHDFPPLPRSPSTAGFWRCCAARRTDGCQVSEKGSAHPT